MNLIPDDVKKNAFIYPYIQSKIVYLYYKLKYREFKNSKMKDFKYKKLPRDVFYKILAKSKAVVDVQMKNQSGLTMRTIEALHFEKKLITTNPAILEYEFYTDNNICVINKNHVNLPPSFFDTDFDTNYSIPKSYSLSAFVETIIQS